MSDAESHEPAESQVTAPTGLTDDLRRLYRVDLPVPPEIDDAVRTMSRRHFTARKRVRHVVRWLSAAAAVAAVLLVVFFAVINRWSVADH